ncbi:uncharacterized protein RJT20DRAFT_124391 [Scheffersomyces xylosifermentans]|uniref:uncharacterized protein n=1 Tax=Scheffersomyces xylosifermentans TaxID=1304137 RepID=UPI00315CE602
MDDLTSSYSANDRLLDSFGGEEDRELVYDYDHEMDENTLKQASSGHDNLHGAESSSSDDRLDNVTASRSERIPDIMDQQSIHSNTSASNYNNTNTDINNNSNSINSSTNTLGNEFSNAISSISTSTPEIGDPSDLESQTTPARMTTKSRILNVLNHLVPIKQTYERINNGLSTGRMQSNTPGRFIGQGTDGVFRNLMAKPDTDANRQEQENNPPSYEEAAADATPEYWESTVISPMYEDEVFVEGLPVGNIANFVWNGLVTVAFQFVGFVLCYLLHTSHAAKQGSRAGLGITFIFYGWGMVPSNFGHADKVPGRYEPQDPNSYDIDKSSSISSTTVDTYNSGFQQHSEGSSSLLTNSSAPYIAYGIIAFGLFIIIKSVVDYYRVKQMERVILSPPNRAATVTSTTENVHNFGEEDEGEPQL